jgi:hypothetical protein
MPHAQQTLREFWQSPARAALEAYWPDPTVGKVQAANKLAACSPGDRVTLDPPLIGSTLAILN